MFGLRIYWNRIQRAALVVADAVHVDPEADSPVVVLCLLEDVLTILAKRQQRQLAEEPSNMFSVP